MMTNHHNDPTRFLCYWNNLSGSFAFSGKPALTDFYFFYEAWVFLQATYVLFGYCYARYDFNVMSITISKKKRFSVQYVQSGYFVCISS